MMYTPRQGRASCVMTYQERVTPIRSFPKLLHDTLASDVGFQVAEKNKLTRFITNEGEYAALIVARGTFEGRPIAHVVAAVFADDFCTLLDARVEADTVDEYAQLVLDLTKADRLELGPTRRRRVGFKPPADWHPIAGLGLDVVLLPPEYPKLHASITVYPAQPLVGTPDPHAFHDRHDEHVGLGPIESQVREVAATGRLGGDQWRTIRSLPNKQGKMVRYLVVLRDERYLYTSKLEAFDGAHVTALHEAFVNMLATMEPIPLPAAARGTRSSVFEIWSD